ncbi:DUF4115 domain-containing protein [Thiotrichales bacterium HSG1]|nr:DUF4115 domain-containing protein [Thiotrichales bacterium HSG1]
MMRLANRETAAKIPVGIAINIAIKVATDEIISSETDTNVDEPTDDKPTNDVNEFEVTLPGMRLRQLREKNNVSLKHVADRLFLDATVVKKLEDDDYGNLPPPIFIRGYMRNYAKLLDIKPESITDDFDPDNLQPKLQPQLKRKEQTNRHDLMPTIGTIAVIIILLVLTAMWRYAPQSTQSVELLPEPQVGEQPLSPESLNVIEPSGEEPSETGEIAGNSAEQPAGETPTANNVSEPVVEIPPPVDDKTLKVHFKARAWIRITDKTNAVLHEGISEDGKVLSLDGTPPFSVKVGNVDGVNIEYKGETKDITSYTKRSGQRNLFIVGNES